MARATASPSLGRLAELAGRAVGAVRRSAAVRSVPGAVGAVAVAVGLGQIYHPLLWIAAGGFLLLLDRRT
jgi:hypothetical protein